MTEAELEARSALWEQVADLTRADRDGDDEEENRAIFEGMLLACERTGLVTKDELEAFRRLAGGAEPAPATGDVAAAERHLAALSADLEPMSRDEDPERFEASRRFHDALRVLDEVALLDPAGVTAWSTRAAEAEMPWLAPDEHQAIGRGEGPMLVALPARDAAEEAADSETDARMERMQREGEVVRVVTARGVVRHGALAVVAVVLRTESTEIHFHHLGDRSLTPPALTDDAGTVYEAVWDEPVSSSGRDGVTTGAWRYQPAAPADVRSFTARVGDAAWEIG